MADSGSIRAGRAFVELFTDDINLVKGLQTASKKLQAWGASITAMGMKSLAAGSALAAPLLAATKTFAEMGTEMARASAKTGVGVEALSQLKVAAEESGVGFEQLQGGLAKMAKGIYDAAQGSPQATQALRALGLSVNDLSHLSPDKQFELIADRVSKIQNPTERAALAMKIFGKSGAELLPLLTQGAAGIDAMRKKADALGLTMSSEDAGAALEFTEKLDQLWEVVKMGVFQIGGALVPVLRAVVAAITNGVQAVRQFITEHKGLIVLAAGIAAGMIAVGVALVALGQVMALVGAAIGTVIAGFGALATVIGALTSPLGLLAAGIVAGTYALMKFTNVGSTVGNFMGQVFGTLKDDATEAFGGIRDAMAAGDWGLAARILWTLIKVEFARGEATVLKLWAELKYALLSTWTTLSSAITTAWSYVTEYLSNWDGVKTAAQKLLTWLNNAFQVTVNAVADTIQDLFMTTGKKQLKIELAKIDADEAAGKYKNGPYTAEQARRAAHRTYDDYDDKQRSQRDSQRQADYDAKQKAIDDAYAAKRPDVVNAAEATRAKIEAEKEAALAKEKSDLEKQLAEAELKGNQDVADLKKQLADLNAKAAKEAKGAKPELKAPAFDKDAAAAGIDTAMKTSVVGTFSAAAVNGLGQSPLNRLRELSEQQLAEQKKINANLKNAGPVRLST